MFGREARSVQAEQFGTENDCQAQAQHQGPLGCGAPCFFADRVEQVHADVAKTREEMVQIRPDQNQGYEFDDQARHKSNAVVERRCEPGKRIFRAHRCVEHPNDERHQQKHEQAAASMQYGHDCCDRHAVRWQVLEGIDVAKLGPLGPGG